MSRYIDADKLSKDVISSWDKDKHVTIEASRVHRQEHHHLMRIIEKQPTADVVEVVRCKDCRYSYVNQKGYLGCNILESSLDWVEPTGYCNLGERSENDDIRKSH